MKTATQHQGLTSKYEYGTITINKTNEPEITISGRFATMTFGNSTVVLHWSTYIKMGKAIANIEHITNWTPGKIQASN
jgi:hypothetical protein